jgi:parallel beta-helix repeat protein
MKMLQMILNVTGQNLKSLLKVLMRYLKQFNFILLSSIVSINCYGAITSISPSDDPYSAIQEALILAQPGDIIHLTEGRYELEDSLSIDVQDIILEGEGLYKTVLSFKNQKSGAQGLSVTSDGVILRDFAIEDAKGDAIKVKGVNGISFIRVRTEWTGGPSSDNGAYGLYPVESRNVLIDSCVAIGASDAGIYVGQSENIIVKNSRAEFNVAGIEIEISYYAYVFDNLQQTTLVGFYFLIYLIYLSKEVIILEFLKINLLITIQITLLQKVILLERFRGELALLFKPTHM